MSARPFKTHATPERHPANLSDTDATGVFYIGLGDRFDDDRRRVRQSEAADDIHPVMNRIEG